MADFGELCPLFTTGVFKEVTFPDIAMTGFSATLGPGGNAMIGTGISAKGASLYFAFGRTVVVTGAYIRPQTIMAASIYVWLVHHTSELATGTAFATFTVAASLTFCEVGATWCPMSLVAGKTFTSSDVLGFAQASNTAADAGVYDLIIRYKEK